MPRKIKSPSTATLRDTRSGRFVGIVDEADARAFRAANTALLREIRGSKERATEVLKASGYLTSTGKVAKRYR